MNIADILLTLAVPLTTVGIMAFTVWAERWLKGEAIETAARQPS